MKKIIFLTVLFAYSIVSQAQLNYGVEISAEQIINNYVEALGGVEAMEKINDYKMTAEESSMRLKLEMITAYKKEPRYTLTLWSMAGKVMYKLTFDGTKAKLMDRAEFSEGERFEAIKADAHLCPDMYYAQNGYKLTVKGIETVNGSDAYVLEVVKEERVMVNYYDTATGLKIKSVTTTDTPRGPVSEVEEMSNYKEVGGFKFPHTLKQSRNGITRDFTVKKIEVNIGLTAEDFN